MQSYLFNFHNKINITLCYQSMEFAINIRYVYTRGLCCKDKKHAPRLKWQIVAVYMSLPTSGRGGDTTGTQTARKYHFCRIYSANFLPEWTLSLNLQKCCTGKSGCHLVALQFDPHVMASCNLQLHASPSCAESKATRWWRRQLLARFFSLSYSCGFLDKGFFLWHNYLEQS